MKKQRWKFTKGKNWLCNSCGYPVKVPKKYQEKICCDGYLCGCYGNPLNPVICNKCHKEGLRKFEEMQRRLQHEIKYR